MNAKDFPDFPLSGWFLRFYTLILCREGSVLGSARRKPDRRWRPAPAGVVHEQVGMRLWRGIRSGLRSYSRAVRVVRAGRISIRPRVKRQALALAPGARRVPACALRRASTAAGDREASGNNPVRVFDLQRHALDSRDPVMALEWLRTAAQTGGTAAETRGHPDKALQLIASAGTLDQLTTGWDAMPRPRSAHAHSVALSGFEKHGNKDAIMGTVKRLIDGEEIEATEALYSQAIDIMVRVGEVGSALELFRGLRDSRQIKTSAPFMAIMRYFLRSGNYDDALAVFHGLLENETPVPPSGYNAALACYRRMGNLAEMGAVLREMKRRRVPADTAIMTQLIGAYGDQDQIENARAAFDMLRNDGLKPTRATYIELLRPIADRTRANDFDEVLRLEVIDEVVKTLRVFEDFRKHRHESKAEVFQLLFTALQLMKTQQRRMLKVFDTMTRTGELPTLGHFYTLAQSLLPRVEGEHSQALAAEKTFEQLNALVMSLWPGTRAASRVEKGQYDALATIPTEKASQEADAIQKNAAALLKIYTATAGSEYDNSMDRDWIHLTLLKCAAALGDVKGAEAAFEMYLQSILRAPCVQKRGPVPTNHSTRVRLGVQSAIVALGNSGLVDKAFECIEKAGNAYPDARKSVWARSLYQFLTTPEQIAALRKSEFDFLLKRSEITGERRRGLHLDAIVAEIRALFRIRAWDMACESVEVLLQSRYYSRTVTGIIVLAAFEDAADDRPRDRLTSLAVRCALSHVDLESMQLRKCTEKGPPAQTDAWRTAMVLVLNKMILDKSVSDKVPRSHPLRAADRAASIALIVHKASSDDVVRPCLARSRAVAELTAAAKMYKNVMHLVQMEHPWALEPIGIRTKVSLTRWHIDRYNDTKHGDATKWVDIVHYLFQETKRERHWSQDSTPSVLGVFQPVIPTEEECIEMAAPAYNEAVRILVEEKEWIQAVDVLRIMGKRKLTLSSSLKERFENQGVLHRLQDLASRSEDAREALGSQASTQSAKEDTPENNTEKATEDITENNTEKEKIDAILKTNESRQQKITLEKERLLSDERKLESENKELELQREKLKQQLQHLTQTRARAQEALSEIQTELKNVNGQIEQLKDEERKLRERLSCVTRFKDVKNGVDQDDTVSVEATDAVRDARAASTTTG